MVLSEGRDLAVEVSGLSKVFFKGRKWLGGQTLKGKLALDNISLQVGRGEMVAVLGVNGSGKSTLIRVLATLTLPDSGQARIFGADACTDAATVRRHINRVSVEASFFKELSPWENLAYAARLYGRKPSQNRSAAEEILRTLGLPKDAMDHPMKHLSRGQQQKVSIARSLLTSPSLLLMDEPTTGLDPRSKREVQKFVATVHAESGATVIICTHDLDEAQLLCDRMIVIDRGRVRADSSAGELIAAYGGGTLEEAFLHLTGKSFDEDSEDEQSEPRKELVTA